MAGNTWTSRHHLGELVEVSTVNGWVLGVITQVLYKGYYEYQIRLTSDGSEITEVARNLRPSAMTFDDDSAPEEPPAIPPVNKPADTAANAEKRFAEINPDDLTTMEKASKANATHKQTSWGVKLFKAWLLETNQQEDFENFSAEALATALRRFYGEVRNKEGHEYSKRSLMCVRAALHRHLTTTPNDVGFNIITDGRFTAANNVLKGHIKLNKKAGLDTSSHYEPISAMDKKKMYDSKVLSNENPTSLQRKVFFEMLLQFGRRAREGLHDLQKEDFVFKKDKNGIEFCTIKHNVSEKNHQGLSQGVAEHEQRLYGTGTSDCPLKSMKMYLAKLNPQIPNFFQTAKKSNYKLSTVWYTKSPMGVNTIGKLMPTISKEAALSKIYTNHCVRATAVTTLRDQGIDSKDIKSVTGHKAESSIDYYSKTPDAVRHQMAMVLAGAERHPESSTSSKKEINLKEISPSTTMFSNVQFSNCNINIHMK